MTATSSFMTTVKPGESMTVVQRRRSSVSVSSSGWRSLMMASCKISIIALTVRKMNWRWPIVIMPGMYQGSFRMMLIIASNGRCGLSRAKGDWVGITPACQLGFLLQ
jgi:hypothetical protein